MTLRLPSFPNLIWIIWLSHCFDGVNAKIVRRDKVFESGLSTDPRIVGGTPAAPGDYPFYVNTIQPILCGATLIYEDIVLTAAHCAGGFLAGVNIGTTMLDGTDAAEFIAVDMELVHPNYDQANRINDIMLVKLSTPAASPVVTLNTDPNVPAADEMVTVIGFGDTMDGGEPSPVLLMVEVNVYTDQFCDDLYQVFEPDTMLCAGTPAGGRDSCQGDSGGPLLTSTNVQIGIASTGSGCGLPDIPAIYTQVSAFQSFIRQGICDLSSNPPSDCGTLGIPSASPTGVEVPVATSSPAVNPVAGPTTSSPTMTPVVGPKTSSPTATPVVGPTTSSPTKTPVAGPTPSLPTETPVTVPINLPTKFPTEIAPAPVPLPITLITKVPSTVNTPTRAPHKIRTKNNEGGGMEMTNSSSMKMSSKAESESKGKGLSKSEKSAKSKSSVKKSIKKRHNGKGSSKGFMKMSSKAESESKGKGKYKSKKSDKSKSSVKKSIKKGNNGKGSTKGSMKMSSKAESESKGKGKYKSKKNDKSKSSVKKSIRKGNYGKGSTKGSMKMSSRAESESKGKGKYKSRKSDKSVKQSIRKGKK